MAFEIDTCYKCGLSIDKVSLFESFLNYFFE